MHKVVTEALPTRLGLLLLGLAVAWGMSYWSTLGLLLEEWSNSGAYSHGFLVLAIVVYLVWRQRTALARCEIRPSVLGLPLLLMAGGVWAIGFLSNVFLLQLLGAIGLMLAAVLAIFGPAVFRRLWFPIVFLLFAVPVWEWLESPLQAMTTEVSFLVLTWLDVPVFRDGHFLTVPGGQFHVEKACSGLSFFLAALTLGMLFAHINQLGVRKGAFFVVYSLALAIFSNWLRVIVIVLVGNHTHMQHPIVQDHVTFGWILYALMLIPLFWVGAKLAARGHAPASPADAAPSVEGGGAWRGVRSPISIAGLALLVLLPWVTAQLAAHGYEESYGYAPPQDAGDWRLVSHGEGLDWEPRYVGASSQHRAVYRASAAPLYLYIANYNRQDQGRELINVENRLYPRDRWIPRGEQVIGVELGGGRKIAVNELALDSGAKLRLVWYWYEIGARHAVGPAQAKLYDLLGIVSGRRGATVFAVATDYHGDKEPAAARLRDFLSAAMLHTPGGAIQRNDE
ncbi:MAG: exosortase A [Pseudomonadota bacterium]